MLWTPAWCTFAGLGALYYASWVGLPDCSRQSLARQFGKDEAPVEGRLLSLNEICCATDLPLADKDNDALADWQLDKPPGANSTGHFIFETVSSLLQHWPNTRMRNGHNIVPGTIPPGTLLYRGTWSPDLPPGPGWTATDPEHSILFCRKLVKEDACWHLTLMSMRTLKVVYFDGSSAAKAPFATMDTQDIIAWGAVQPGRSLEEMNRIEDLCKWGRQYSVDGFVRMEMDFEIMLCNFTSGVRLVSSLNLAGSVILMSNTSSRRSSRMFEAMYAGSWHNHYPGETRIRLDLSGLVSFYDTELVPSLVSARSGQERRDHRLLNVSREDVARVRARLGEVLTRPTGQSSGIDWRAMIRVVVDRYSERLEFVRYLLNSVDTNDWNSVTDYAIKTQVQLRNMLVPYILVNTTPPSINLKTKEAGSGTLNWARLTYKLCATTHTEVLDDLTSSEKVLLSAVRETTREICRVVTKMWGSGVLAGVGQFMGTVSELDVEVVQNLIKMWRKDIDDLMAWLDWSVWVKCRPACGPEEICYLTTWPVGFPMPLPYLPYEEGYVLPLPSQLTQCKASVPVGPPHIELADDWERPQPRCTRRTDPYDKSFGDHP
ncbi:hypothetical protein EDD16DRAFT_1468489 [Pisolithus croceorrhizus]|nr:hypothetical protein EV401DRAFT_447247 [Pisolithus croceorrhizus]KAI6132476.1 hypothetical protein EDD16DRAFT_1468489 [Pisolithus croceorrhizus]KAI6168805.1 hypothetical protein EDD17DRAFT_1465781 [Pisolithus thermaeus]